MLLTYDNNKPMIKISWLDLQRWIKDGQQPRDYVFAVWLNQFIDDEDQLPEDFLRWDWSQSFGQPVVIYYDERLTIQTLIVLQKYLRSQAADIENIVLVMNPGVGIADWWRQHNQLYQEKSFRIVEWLYVRTVQFQKYYVNWQPTQKKKNTQEISKDQNIQYLFCHYGGTNPKVDRQYLALKLRNLDPIGIVDMMSTFTISRQQLVNHAHYLGYFKNPAEEKLIGDLYDRYVRDQKLILNPMLREISNVSKIKDEIFDRTGFQYALDCRCLAVVINETDNTQPWSIVSEKTLRPFWHYKIVIHPGYNSTMNLEKCGFWFPHDIIDYSYQHETDWLTRINALISSVERTHQQMQNRYQEYWLDNTDKFQHNAELLQHYYHTDFDPAS